MGLVSIKHFQKTKKKVLSANFTARKSCQNKIYIRFSIKQKAAIYATKKRLFCNSLLKTCDFFADYLLALSVSKARQRVDFFLATVFFL